MGVGTAIARILIIDCDFRPGHTTVASCASRSESDQPESPASEQPRDRALSVSVGSRTMDELRISPQNAAKKVAAGDAILLDVVTTPAWLSLSKVPRGALRIPPEEIADRLDELPPTGEVIAFCT